MARSSARRGVTLLELLVVIILIALATGLVIPALRSTAAPVPSVSELIPTARDAAARRGESVRLEVGADGTWRLTGDAAGDSIAGGRVASFAGLPLTLVVGPLGSCQIEPRDDSRVGGATGSDRPPEIDPLTCEVRSP
jgi:prepilin-type N-terminal cleavage/methylation domain-containing protein